MTVPTASSRNTTPPWTAWLDSCSTLPRKVGASEANRPSREKAANPAAPAAMNSARPRSGMPRSAKRNSGRLRGLTVSGTRNKHRPATTSTARYTSNTKVVGWGAY